MGTATPSQQSNRSISLAGETQGNHSDTHFKECEGKYVFFFLVLVANDNVVYLQ